MDYGFRITKPGYNALTETNDRNLIMTSKRNCLKEFLSGTVNIVTDGSGSGSVSVNHNLGYFPLYYAFSKYDDDTWNPVGSEITNLFSYATTTTLNFSIVGRTDNFTYKVFYIVFIDQLT